MSRKRKLKKQQKRRMLWVQNLEDLYLQRADEAFLEAARPHVRELDGTSLAGPYREVAGRALAGALSGGDPARVGELLAGIERDAAPRPLVLLAEAVDLLADGRRESAAARLAALDETGKAAAGVAPHLPEMLRALAGSAGVPAAGVPAAEADGAGLWREIGEMARFCRTLEAHTVAASEEGPPRRLPRSLELQNPCARAAWQLYRALAVVGARGFRPGAKTLQALARAVDAVRSAGGVDAPLERLLSATEERLRVLVNLRKIEQTLRRRRRGAQLEKVLLERLGAAGGLSARLLHDPPPALLRPLQQALRTRWRSLLELIAERRGTAGLAALLAARPELLAADLEPGAGVAEARRWTEVKALLGAESFGELAAFLRSAGAPTETPERLAALWSLELWARRETTWGLDRGEIHQVLVRLLEMATAVSGRFAAVERPQVARFLRDELLELCQALFFCNHFLAAAEALLEHLTGDAGLLAVALAGAVSSRDDRARRRYAAQIATRGPAPADREILLRLVESFAAERSEVSVPVFTALRPLFADAGWSEALDRLAAEALEGIRDELVDAWVDAIEDPEAVVWSLNQIRRDLDLYRPLLGEHPELAALDVAVGCWRTPSAAELHVGHFLSRFEGLEPALTLYRLALELRGEDPRLEIEAAIAEAVIDRLDARPKLWVRYLPSLIFAASPEQLRRLDEKIRGFTEDEPLDEDEREMLRKLGTTLGELRDLTAETASIAGLDLALPEPPEEPEPRPVKPRARRRRPVDDRQLELFALE